MTPLYLVTGTKTDPGVASTTSSKPGTTEPSPTTPSQPPPPPTTARPQCKRDSTTVQVIMFCYRILI